MAEDMIEAVGDAAGGSANEMLVRFLWRCGTFFTGAVALALGALYAKQESLLYFPSIGNVPRHTSQNPRRYRSPAEHDVPFETHRIPCQDGVSLHSWLLYHPDAAGGGGGGGRRRPTIVFFHGNAGNIGMRLPNAVQMHRYLRANVWLIEYRGYGDSDDATVNESGLKSDAEAVWEYVHDPRTRGGTAGTNAVDPRGVFVFGRSLGGAVAFHMARYAESTAHPPLAGVIAENTFLSISEMVDHLMPLVAKVKMLILRMRWDNGEVVPTLRSPTLFLAGAKDTLVPHSHMLELFDRRKRSGAGGVVRMHVVEDGTHNETWMQGGRAYWIAIQRFLDEVVAAEAATGASLSRSGGAAGVNNASDGAGGRDGPFQRKGSAGPASAMSSSCSSSSGDCAEPVEVDMGHAGEDAADMISSVGNIVGMAKEATRSVASGVKVMGATSLHNKKD
ncbi:hypothetical protein ACHAWF_011338 [Thalassiosira exigua]